MAVRTLTYLTLAVLAGSPSVLPAQRAAIPDLVWPAPPETARVRYLGALTGEADLGRREGFFRRLARVITGGRRERTLHLERPFDVHAGAEGRLFVTNGLRGGLVVLDRGSRAASVLGGDVPGGIGKAMGLGGDARGYVYLADAGARRIVVFDAAGRFVRFVGGSRLLYNPVDVAATADGRRVYVVDSYLHQVLVFDTAGSLVTRIGRQAVDLASRTTRTVTARTTTDGDGTALPHPGGTTQHLSSDLWQNRGGEPSEMRYPVSVAVAPDGEVYVSDQLNFRVQVFDPEGRFLRTFGSIGDRPGTFTRPKGIAIDRHGHVYVVDAAFNNVQMFDREGRLLLAFGSLGNGPGQHWLPIGITVDAEDRIYVADRYNNRAQLYAFLADPAAPLASAEAGRR